MVAIQILFSHKKCLALIGLLWVSLPLVYGATIDEVAKQQGCVARPEWVAETDLFKCQTSGAMSYFAGDPSWLSDEQLRKVRLREALVKAEESYRRGEYTVAFTSYLELATSGHATSQGRVGKMLEQGEGVPQDYSKAIIWYRKAATQGDFGAQHSLGLMYEKGLGAPTNFSEAVKWQRLAADRGYAVSQFAMARLYMLGRGVPVDLVQAHKWANLAAASLPPGPREHVTQTRERIAAQLTVR